MKQENKFCLKHPYPHIDPKIHSKDKKFYPIAYNNKDKLVVTCEEKYMEKKEEIFEEYGIKILSIKEAIDDITKFHSKILERNI